MQDAKGGNGAAATTPQDRVDAETARPSQLDEAQADGLACTICGSEMNPMKPIGTHLGVQLFMCISHDNPPESVEPLTADQLAGRACVTCGATDRPMRVSGEVPGHGDVYECAEHSMPYWLPEPCPAWCKDIHERSDEESDRLHTSPWQIIPVTTMGMENFGRGSGTPSWVAHTAEVSLQQGYREVEPRVLQHDAANDRWHAYFTLDEAEEHAKNILSLVAQARGQAGDVSI
ncbi:hypothetical protein [Nonomuraea sp. NPDC049141]|uniref:DUF6907 domain-containing protein n=1 Tax=Nonomuraea sp. NPDC049141 TaxID=3155500 RepID=UPI0033D48AE5